MQPYKEENNTLSLLAQETEALLEELFLSGFRSTRKSTLEQLERLKEEYAALGMDEGAGLTGVLSEAVRREQESFAGSPDKSMDAYARLEFYLEHLKNSLRELT